MNNIKEDPVTQFNKWVDQYLNFEKLPQKNIFWLDTMNYICNRLNMPQNASRCVHVAGSKGKGSVSKMISNILSEAGYKTGLYSSPHILNFVERISSSSGPFNSEVYEKSSKELINSINSIIPENLPGQRPITWFELVTAYAMLCFKNAGCDWSVYEVGLGGRLDATNVINPEICCITQIELEHTEYLGDTVEKIAAEKGGIIKENTPVVIASQKESVKEVFKKIAEEKHAPLFFIDELCNISGTSYILENKRMYMTFTVSAPVFKRDLNLKLSMTGDFQAKNAALAAVAVKKIYPELDELIIEKGINETVLPARFEMITDDNYESIPYIVLDGAHTVNSVHFTTETFSKLQELNGQQSAVLLYASAADKDVEDIVKYFKTGFSKIILTRPGEDKKADLPRAENAFNSENIEHTSCKDFVKAIDLALKSANEQQLPLLVTGSFYLIAEVKKYLLAKKCVQ